MNAGAALLVALVLAVLLVLAYSKPTRKRVAGLMYRDPKGRLVLVLSPATKRKGKK